MGTCTTLITKNLLASLLLNYHDDSQAIVLSASKWGNEDNLYFCKVESKHLPDGYHGMQDIIIEQYDVKFKKDVDV